MVDKVRNYIETQHLIERGDRLVVGVSGGADSVALLFVLQELRVEYDIELFVVHINHGIRDEASADAEYVRNLCESMSISFYLFEEDIPALAKKQGMTEEEMGRTYRYQCFFEVMKQVGADKIAVAHHTDDQAETLLFHLVRGSRLSGMVGMKAVMDISLSHTNNNTARIIRPLLTCRKEELTDWLSLQNVTWKEDCTNQDNTYSRNCIRNQVIPLLEQVNSQAIAHMSEYAEEMSEYQEFVQDMVYEYMEKEVHVKYEYQETSGDTHTGGVHNSVMFCELNRNHVLQQKPVFARTVIYEILCKVCGKKKDIGNVHVQAVYDLLKNQSGKKVSLPYGMEAVISYEMLQIRKELQRTSDYTGFEVKLSPKQISEKQDIQLPNGRQICVQIFRKELCTENEWKDRIYEAENSKNDYTKYFECDTINDTLCVRTAKSGDYFVMNDSGATKKLSRYFIDRKISVEKRKEILVVASGSKVLWIIGERRCEDYKVTYDSESILVLRYKGE